MVTPRPETRARIDFATKVLVKEFGHVSREQIVGEVETVAEALLRDARFDNYVPILAHRFARDHLQQLQAVEVVAEAA